MKKQEWIRPEWRELKQVTNNGLEKFMLNFSEEEQSLT